MTGSCPFSFCVLLAAGCSVPPPPGPGSGQVLASVREPFALAIDSTRIYVAPAEPAPLVAVPLDGGEPATFVSTATTAVAAYDGWLYWTDGTSILGCDTSDCAASTFTVAPDDAKVLAIDATNLYWATVPQSSGGSRIMKAARNGGTPAQLATANFARALAVDAHDVYWVDDFNGLVSAPLLGGTARQVTLSDSTMSGLALDDGNVYFTTIDGKLFTVAKSGGAARVLLTDLGPGAVAVATDGRNVYVPSVDALVKMAVTGGPVTVLATSLTYITAITLDATNVYAAAAGQGYLVTARK